MPQFSLRRIKTPERGLLAMHPFVDVLEGRNLFTGSIHDGMLDVTTVVDVPAHTAASPWSDEAIDSTSAEHVDDAVPGLTVTAGDPAHIALDETTAPSAFASGQTIGDKDQFLFGNNLWDRRGKQETLRLPTEEELDDARLKMSISDDDAASVFHTGRAMTGAMRPYLTMTASQSENLFAA